MRLLAAALIAFAVNGFAQSAAPDATPVDAIPAILDLFKTYQVVGLGEVRTATSKAHGFARS